MRDYACVNESANLLQRNVRHLMRGTPTNAVALAAGVQQSWLHRIETGKTRSPRDTENLEKLARHFGVSAADLMFKDLTVETAADAVAESQSGRFDPDKLRTALNFLEDLFASYDREFVASAHVALLSSVYLDLELHPGPPNLVRMTRLWGPHAELEIEDERQREARGAVADDRSGDREDAQAAEAKARRA